MTCGVILPCEIQQAARLQHAAFGVAQAAGGGGHSLFFYFDRVFGRVNDRLKLLHLGLQRRIAGSDVIFFRAGDPALAVNVIEMAFHALGQNVIERGLLVVWQRLVGDEDQAEHAFAQLVDDHGAQRQRVIAGAAIRIASLVDHYCGHAADRRGIFQFAILHAGHQHHERVEALVGNHVG